jgi:hypothetical protein
MTCPALAVLAVSPSSTPARMNNRFAALISFPGAFFAVSLVLGRKRVTASCWCCWGSRPRPAQDCAPESAPAPCRLIASAARLPSSRRRCASSLKGGPSRSRTRDDQRRRHLHIDILTRKPSRICPVQQPMKIIGWSLSYWCPGGAGPVLRRFVRVRSRVELA